MRPRISISRHVCPSVRRSVGRSVGLSVGPRRLAQISLGGKTQKFGLSRCRFLRATCLLFFKHSRPIFWKGKTQLGMPIFFDVPIFCVRCAYSFISIVGLFFTSGCCRYSHADTELVQILSL